MDAIEAIAHLLAAEKDPALKATPAYAEAEAMVQANQRMADWLQREREFFSRQDGLLSGLTLSDEARLRIGTALEQASQAAVAPAGQMIAFPRRMVWAAAAAVVALLLGATFLAGLRTGEQRQYAAAQQDTSLEAFRQFSVNQVDSGFRLDYRTPSSQQVVAWLADEKGAVPKLSDSLSRLPTMGCKVVGWNQHKVSLICFEQAKGETVHMFVVDRKAHAPGGLPSGIVDVNGHATRYWQDQRCTYLMVAHDKGQPLRPNSI